MSSHSPNIECQINPTTESVPSLNEPVATSIIDTQYTYNPYSRNYQNKSTQPKPTPLPQRILRSHENDHKFWIGDDMSYRTHHQHTRLILHTCNGGFMNRDNNFIKSKFTNYLQHSTHYLSIVETKVNMSNASSLKQINSSFSEITNGGTVKTNNTPNFSNQTHSQPGGVLSAFYGKLHQRYNKSGFDKYGR